MSEIPPRSVAVGAGFDCKKCSICPNSCFGEGQVFSFGELDSAFGKVVIKSINGRIVTAEGPCAHTLQGPLKIKVRI